MNYRDTSEYQKCSELIQAAINDFEARVGTPLVLKQIDGLNPTIDFDEKVSRWTITAFCGFLNYNKSFASLDEAVSDWNARDFSDWLLKWHQSCAEISAIFNKKGLK